MEAWKEKRRLAPHAAKSSNGGKAPALVQTALVTIVQHHKNDHAVGDDKPSAQHRAQAVRGGVYSCHVLGTILTSIMCGTALMLLRTDWL